MLYVGLDLSRKRLDWQALDPVGRRVAIGAAPPDRDGLAGAPDFRLHLVKHRRALKQRVHAILFQHGLPNPHRDLFGAGGRCLLDRLQLDEPWASTVKASVELIDQLDEQIHACEQQLRRLGADHRYVPLLTTLPGVAWVLGYTIASEIGDINRFASPRKLVGYTGLTPRVEQSGERDRRGPLRKNGPDYLR
jgi:transposase